MADMLTKNLAFLIGEDSQAQKDLARKVGVNQATISKWKRLAPGSEPGFRSMAALANVLGLSLDDLMHRDLAAEGPSPASQSGKLDAGKLTTVMQVVEGAIADSRRRVPVEFKARMIKRVYEGHPPITPETAGAVQAALAGILETVGDE